MFVLLATLVPRLKEIYRIYRNKYGFGNQWNILNIDQVCNILRFSHVDNSTKLKWSWWDFKSLSWSSKLHNATIMNQIWVIFIGIVLVKLCQGDRVAVHTEYGNVIGESFLLHNGKTVNRFHGIPYARPPVGEYRFKVGIT